MKPELIFFTPIGRKTVWGGTTVKDYFHYPEMTDDVGQAWAFADQPDGLSNICVTLPLSGMTLHDIWEGHPEFFNSQYRHFPFIVSLVGPEADLSIQLHPDKVSAQKYGFHTGKNEAWYFLEVNNSSLVYGHCADSKEQLLYRIGQNDFTGLFKTIPAEKDSFVYLPAGMIHALGKGNIVYEIQQATDLTWRIYDYERTDNHGQQRELHISQALEVLNNVADDAIKSAINSVVKSTQKGSGYELDSYRTETVFSVSKLLCHGSGHLMKDRYWLCTVTKGKGIINGENISCGDNFVIIADCHSIDFAGDFTLMITSENK